MYSRCLAVLAFSLLSAVSVVMSSPTPDLDAVTKQNIAVKNNMGCLGVNGCNGTQVAATSDALSSIRGSSMPFVAAGVVGSVLTVFV
ncbi:hypothetical protein C8Q75DRAFT_762456 [Abortiporus biennis]|nr:hypothetical protein C8Q75DRAFT_762456 [Abortiporus biennis]